MFARGDSAEFVSALDPATAHEGAKPCPDSDWYCADGQPPLPNGPDRIRVRSLTEAEVMQTEGAAESVFAIGKLGFVSRNGEAIEYDSLPAQWKVSVGLLVWAVTLNPLTVRPFRWTAPPSAETPTSAP